jgi:hypothetical protein
MRGFKAMNSARVILGGIEMIHMMRKGQAKYARNSQPSLAEQFDLLAAWIHGEARPSSRPYSGFATKPIDLLLALRRVERELGRKET